MIKSKIYYRLAWLFILLGVVSAFWYLNLLRLDGLNFWNSGHPDIEKTGQFGDFIGGFVGTLFSLAGFIFLYLTLKEQRIAFKKERFENHFFELLKIHRDNISELAYTKYSTGEMRKSENRKVFKDIFKEFEECYLEVRKFLNSKDANDYYTPRYKKYIETICSNNAIEIPLHDLAKADIAYCIVFFGIGKEGRIILRNLFQRKYKAQYYLQVLEFIRMKPKRENVDAYINWLTLNLKEYKLFKKALENIYYHNKPNNEIVLTNAEKDVFSNIKLNKYYEGHHHRLGHYFRHLFQSYKFISNQTDFSFEDKYVYCKTLRAQLSPYEQSLLFINSISCLGMKWDYLPENNNFQKKITGEAVNLSQMISSYNLIKNLSGKHIYGLYFKKFYPKVLFEYDEIQVL